MAISGLGKAGDDPAVAAELVMAGTIAAAGAFATERSVAGLDTAVVLTEISPDMVAP